MNHIRKQAEVQIAGISDHEWNKVVRFAIKNETSSFWYWASSSPFESRLELSGAPLQAEVLLTAEVLVSLLLLAAKVAVARNMTGPKQIPRLSFVILLNSLKEAILNKWFMN